MKIIDVGAAVLINEKQEVLITHRAPKENFAGGWEFPGGKLEENETIENCIIRELKEELNLDINLTRFCAENVYHYSDQLCIKLIAYYGKIIAGNINLSVHDSFIWAKIVDLSKFDFLPADIPIVQQIIEDLKYA